MLCGLDINCMKCLELANTNSCLFYSELNFRKFTDKMSQPQNITAHALPPTRLGHEKQLQKGVIKFVPVSRRLPVQSGVSSRARRDSPAQEFLSKRAVLSLGISLSTFTLPSTTQHLLPTFSCFVRHSLEERVCWCCCNRKGRGSLKEMFGGKQRSVS